jgi:hypothetical protein
MDTFRRAFAGGFLGKITAPIVIAFGLAVGFSPPE